ncbi:hypothetical protein Q1695_013861 [Nippostrongylus brasiliensis]|nr:hypothetical protein Q1695_013861 [Nippostrongylus brasiliensis]
MSAIVLDPRSIVEALTCLKVDISAEDIVHPTAARVQAIYFAYCTEILEIPERSLSELPFECQLSPDVAERHQKSVPLVLLFSTLRSFVMDIGDGKVDFSMCDLINPTAKRTRKLFSLLADYVNYYKTAARVFEKTSSEYSEARIAIEQGQEQIRLAEERKSALLAEKDSRKRKENALLAEYNKKNSVFNDVVKEAETHEARRDATLKSIEKAKEDVATAAAETNSLKSQIAYLSNGVVTSPDRVRRDIEEQRAIIKDLQEKCAAERQRIRENDESMVIIEQISRLIDERFVHLDKLLGLKAQVDIAEHDATEAKALVIEASKHKTQTEEALKRVVITGENEAKNHSRAVELYRNRLVELKRKKEELTSETSALRDKTPSVYRESTQLQKEIVRLRNERTADAEEARAHCAELLRRFNDLLQKYDLEEQRYNTTLAAFQEVTCAIENSVNDVEVGAGDGH